MWTTLRNQGMSAPRWPYEQPVPGRADSQLSRVAATEPPAPGPGRWRRPAWITAALIPIVAMLFCARPSAVYAMPGGHKITDVVLGRAELAAHGMIASMSGKGDCYDNAVAESFFATLELELLMKNNLAHSGRSSARDLPIYRDVAQPEAASLNAGLRQPSGVRRTTAGGSIIPITYASTKSGQAQFVPTSALHACPTRQARRNYLISHCVI